MPPAVYLGTSGFSFDDWRGVVYPERLPKPQWLIYYEQQLRFTSLEINYTYYQMPSHRTMEGLLRKTSAAFRFAIKTHRSMTHDVVQRDGALVDAPQAFADFLEGMRPLATSGKLGCVLAQFPYAFVNTPATRDYLARVMERLREVPLVVEFRHTSWATPQTFETLRAQGVGWCILDEPTLPRLMPWTPEVTAPIAYARFHGRNAEAWFGTSTADRYNYLYSAAELQELVTRIARLPAPAKTLFLYFNNCHAGSAAKNALQFRELLIQHGLLAAPPA